MWLSLKFILLDSGGCRLLHSPWPLSLPGGHCKPQVCNYKHLNTLPHQRLLEETERSLERLEMEEIRKKVFKEWVLPEP